MNWIYLSIFEPFSKLTQIPLINSDHYNSMNDLSQIADGSDGTMAAH